MTKKREKKAKIGNGQSDGASAHQYELKIHIDENFRSKVVSQKHMSFIQKDIDFNYYLENKNTVRIVGDDLQQLRGISFILESLTGAYKKLKNPNNDELIEDLLDDLVDEVVHDTGSHNYSYDPDAIIKTTSGRYISARTDNQEKLVESIRDNVITIAKGCAGTGKSTLAVAMAINYLYDNRFDKILLVRPLTSVGGKDIGFLPGSAEEKVAPYASALTESIVDIIGEPKFNDLVRTKKIIITPTTFTRGANFKNAIVIVDEAQNLSEVEILTLLTRLCSNGKIIITGDESQDDRKDKRFNASALTTISDKLADIENVGIVKMTVNDVQRHGIVRDIIEAFE